MAPEGTSPVTAMRLSRMLTDNFALQWSTSWCRNLQQLPLPDYGGGDGNMGAMQE